MAEANRRRLLVIATTYPRWSGDHEPGFVHELAKRLVGRFDVVAIVPHANGALDREVLDGVAVERYRYAPRHLESLVQDGGITTHLRRSPWKWLLVPGFFLMQWLTARRFAKAGSIVHAHWILLPGLVARLLRRPYLITSHGADLFALRGRVPTFLKRKVLQAAAQITVVSSAMSPVATQINRGRVPQVAPMGVDLSSRFTPNTSIARDEDHLLFVGRLVEKKGIDVLLAAMPSLLEKRPSLRLSIIGHGPLQSMLQAQAEKLGVACSVTFLGPVSSEQLPDHYRRATAFIAPFTMAASGDQEGLGLVLVEALGCGCPVVTTDIPAVADLAEVAPCIVRVKAGSAECLEDGVLSLLENKTSFDAVRAARTRLCERFDWAHVASRYEKMLLGIAG